MMFSPRGAETKCLACHSLSRTFKPFGLSQSNALDIIRDVFQQGLSLGLQDTVNRSSPSKGKLLLNSQHRVHLLDETCRELHKTKRDLVSQAAVVRGLHLAGDYPQAPFGVEESLKCKHLRSILNSSEVGISISTSFL